MFRVIVQHEPDCGRKNHGQPWSETHVGTTLGEALGKACQGRLFSTRETVRRYLDAPEGDTFADATEEAK